MLHEVEKISEVKKALLGEGPVLSPAESVITGPSSEAPVSPTLRPVPVDASASDGQVAPPDFAGYEKRANSQRASFRPDKNKPAPGTSQEPALGVPSSKTAPADISAPRPKSMFSGPSELQPVTSLSQRMRDAKPGSVKSMF